MARSLEDGSPFDEHLAGAAQEVIRGRWRPSPMAEWVTCVPSAAHPGLNEAFAQRLATLLGIPFASCLTTEGGSPQVAMQNSAEQAANAALEARDPRHASSVRLPLVDDLVDSRWTLTVAGAMLRDHGAGPVLPFALAVATPHGE